MFSIAVKLTAAILLVHVVGSLLLPACFHGNEMPLPSRCENFEESIARLTLRDTLSTCELRGSGSIVTPALRRLRAASVQQASGTYMYVGLSSSICIDAYHKSFALYKTLFS